MTLHEVRRWALQRGLTCNLFRQCYHDAFRLAVSNLLRAVHREALAPSSVMTLDGVPFLRIGEETTTLLAPISASTAFGRIEVIGPLQFHQKGYVCTLRTTRPFQRALRTAVGGASELAQAFDQLVSDFDNSLANLVLNRLLFHSGERAGAIIEPAYQGHSVHPFPGLRQGPSLDLILACSHLSHQPVALPFLRFNSLNFSSWKYADYSTCLEDSTGRLVDASSDMLIPVHPWQLALSPIIRSLLELGLCSLDHRTVDAMPLTSERTCRILATGFDVKLPVNATITGEHRLLSPSNVKHATVISAIASASLRLLNTKTIDFQYDLATLSHADTLIGTHIAAIVRSPIAARSDEQLVQALTLWSATLEAEQQLPTASAAEAEDLFSAYCRILMIGPIEFYSRFGLAFEPHLQNTFIRIRRGRPTGIVLRDLDGTILDAPRIPSLIKSTGLPIVNDRWPTMPSFADGGRRLTHALLHSHLGVVAAHLIQSRDARPAVLEAAIQDTWADLVSSAETSVRKLVLELREHAASIKCLLRMRLLASDHLVFLGAQERGVRKAKPECSK